MRRATKLLLTVLIVVPLASVQADEQHGTLELDGFSYISYSLSEKAPLPPGSSIRFHFGVPDSNGSVPITVRPEDVSIAPVPIAEGVTIHYGLAGSASGTIRKVAGNAEIELFATLVASLAESPEIPSVAYELRFTTGTAEAANSAGTEGVTVDGVPVVGPNYVQLVGAATNRPEAFPGPGEAVFAILSGRFDWLPALP